MWDKGRKLFAAHTKPEILGYCGEAIFPTQTIGQVLAAIDEGVLDKATDPAQRAQHVRDIVVEMLHGYPPQYTQSFSILYCTRQGYGMRSSLHCFEIKFDAVTIQIAVMPIPLPDMSGVIAIRGSGSHSVKKWTDRWVKSKQAGGGTSRAVFSGFCDAVRSGEDPGTGGSPQLVGLYRKDAARTFGISWAGQPFIYGLHLRSLLLTRAEWRNQRFERCDQGGARLPNATPRPRPGDIGD